MAGASLINYDKLGLNYKYIYNSYIKIRVTSGTNRRSKQFITLHNSEPRLETK